VDRSTRIGAEIPNFVVQALALDDEYGVDGLLGMNFLENDNFTVRPGDREIHLEPVGSGESPPAGQATSCNARDGCSAVTGPARLSSETLEAYRVAAAAPLAAP
jgi:hypothetical protein